MISWRWPILVLLPVLMPGCKTGGEGQPTSAPSEIRALLDQQVKDWNEGSIERFMRGYERSAMTRFASGDEIR